MTGIDIPKILELAPSPAYVVDLGRLRLGLEEFGGGRALLRCGRDRGN
jgi:hypothetical protein